MRPLKVLILENNPFQLMALHQMLNAFRIFDVLTAESVGSARESLHKCGAVDVAICDLYMDSSLGLELISELARKRSARAVIILSAAAPPAIESAALMAGKQGLKVLGCLPKPVTLGGLGQLLDSYQRTCPSAGSVNTN